MSEDSKTDPTPAQNPSAEEAKGPLSLAELAKDLDPEHVKHVITLHELEKKYGLAEKTLQLQRDLAEPFAKVFLRINGVIIFLLVILGIAEWNAIQEGQEIERLVNSEVIMTVIGATTVQLGAIMLTIARGLFRVSSTKPDDSD